MIRCEKVTKAYGGVLAVDRVSLKVKAGETVGLIGSNGAGKTSLFNILTGFEMATQGHIYLRTGEREIRIDRLRPHERTKKGIGRTFQNVRLFEGMTAYENVLAGALGTGQDREKAAELLQELGLWEERETLAGELPYGRRKLVELARCLASGARVLLLDEPAAGLNEEEALELAKILGEIREGHRLTLLLIEHNMDFILRLCSRLYAMDLGRVLCEGLPREVLRDPRVIDAVFGGNAYAVT